MTSARRCGIVGSSRTPPSAFGDKQEWALHRSLLGRGQLQRSTSQGRRADSARRRTADRATSATQRTPANGRHRVPSRTAWLNSRVESSRSLRTPFESNQQRHSPPTAASAAASPAWGVTIGGLRAGDSEAVIDRDEHRWADRACAGEGSARSVRSVRGGRARIGGYGVSSSPRGRRT